MRHVYVCAVVSKLDLKQNLTRKVDPSDHLRWIKTNQQVYHFMRSSKSRSRSKSNRNRSMGNVVNRVFDSSGPEGKVRGTPQQVIEKYNQLARDAQLSGDRVAAENFAQHAEHYTRLLAKAMKEQEARREQQEAERREKDTERAQRQKQSGNDSDAESNPEQVATETGEATGSDEGEAASAEGNSDKPRKPRRSRKPRTSDKSEAAAEDQSAGAPKVDAAENV